MSTGGHRIPVYICKSIVSYTPAQCNWNSKLKTQSDFYLHQHVYAKKIQEYKYNKVSVRPKCRQLWHSNKIKDLNKWRHILYSWRWRLSIFKTLIFPNVICRYNRFSIKSKLFGKYIQIDPKVYLWKRQKTYDDPHRKEESQRADTTEL